MNDKIEGDPIPQESLDQEHEDQGDEYSNVDPQTGKLLTNPDGTPYVPEADDAD